MDRVKDAARANDAKWYQAWSKNFPQNGQFMTKAQFEAAKARNARWINTKMKQNYEILDIGIDINRANRSPFYQLEQHVTLHCQRDKIAL